jgi:Cft2 family RNA processing exonuclease
MLRVEFVRGSCRLPELGLWLDARRICQDQEWAFISHAHTDHIAAHPCVILSAPTARFLRARLPGTRQEHILPYGQAMEIPAAGTPARLTLLPAGHIFGSAMAWVEAGGRSLLYTGDFKLRPSRSAETCTPCRADVLVMETTFGRPQYRFPPTAEVLNAVIRFCREALDNDETPVLLGYSLGKSQELLSHLATAGLPVMLHGAIWKVTRLYEELGQSFPPHEPYDARTAAGKVLLWPPGAGLPPGVEKPRAAVLTGWAMDPRCRFRYRCAAAFPWSDHADFDELQDMVRQVRPRKILTLHGFAADFAATLRAAGYDAHALSEPDQLFLPFGAAGVEADRRQTPD